MWLVFCLFVYLIFSDHTFWILACLGQGLVAVASGHTCSEGGSHYCWSPQFLVFSIESTVGMLFQACCGSEVTYFQQAAFSLQRSNYISPSLAGWLATFEMVAALSGCSELRLAEPLLGNYQVDFQREINFRCLKWDLDMFVITASTSLSWLIPTSSSVTPMLPNCWNPKKYSRY